MKDYIIHFLGLNGFKIRVVIVIIFLSAIFCYYDFLDVEITFITAIILPIMSSFVLTILFDINTKYGIFRPTYTFDEIYVRARAKNGTYRIIGKHRNKEPIVNIFETKGITYVIEISIIIITYALHKLLLEELLKIKYRDIESYSLFTEFTEIGEALFGPVRLTIFTIWDTFYFFIAVLFVMARDFILKN